MQASSTWLASIALCSTLLSVLLLTNNVIQPLVRAAYHHGCLPGLSQAINDTIQSQRGGPTNTTDAGRHIWDTQMEGGSPLNTTVAGRLRMVFGSPHGSKIHEIEPKVGKLYYMLQKVMIQNGSVVVFSSGLDEVDSDVRPTGYTYWYRNHEIPFVYETFNPPHARCTSTEARTAVLFHQPLRFNVFHNINDAYLAVYQTLQEHQLLPAELPARCANATCTAAEVALSEVVLIATGDKGAWPVTAPHAYLMNYISNDQRVLDDLNGQCFDRLFVGSSQVLDFNQNIGHPDLLPLRTDALMKAREYIRRSARADAIATGIYSATSPNLPHERLTPAEWKPEPPAHQQKRVIVVSRRPPGTRLILNEANITNLIRRVYKIDAVTATFQEHLSESIELLRSADMFIGMHGAGMTNLIFLPVGCVSIQLFPWGMRKAGEDSVDREYIYRNMAQAMLSNQYHCWVNPEPRNGYTPLNPAVRGDVSVIMNLTAREHPNLDLPAWSSDVVYQDTMVDLNSFTEVLDPAFREMISAGA